MLESNQVHFSKFCKSGGNVWKSVSSVDNLSLTSASCCLGTSVRPWRISLRRRQKARKASKMAVTICGPSLLHNDFLKMAPVRLTGILPRQSSICVMISQSSTACDGGRSVVKSGKFRVSAEKRTEIECSTIDSINTVVLPDFLWMSDKYLRRHRWLNAHEMKCVSVSTQPWHLGQSSDRLVPVRRIRHPNGSKPLACFVMVTCWWAPNDRTPECRCRPANKIKNL